MHKTYYFLLMVILLVALIPIKSVDILTQSRKKTINVELKGEVENPGVYTLNSGASVEDLLALTQLGEDADLSAINRNAPLCDRDVIVVGQISEQQKVSINSASLQQLQTLPGIGPALAQRIVDYRETYGSFQSLEELMNVKGIGEKNYEKLKEYICL